MAAKSKNIGKCEVDPLSNSYILQNICQGDTCALA